MTEAEIIAALSELHGKRDTAILVRRMSVVGMRLNDCHQNVERYIEGHPDCQAVTGWLLLPLFEDCFRFMPHSAVRFANRELVDVTPMHDEKISLKFLLDDSLLLRKAIETKRGYFDFPPLPMADIVCEPPDDDDDEF